MKEWVQERLKRRSKTDGIVLILTGVLILIVLLPTGGSRVTQKTKETSIKEEAGNSTGDKGLGQSDTEYIEKLEEQVRTLVESMDGVGKARVMLTLSDDGMTHLDKNVKVQEQAREETTVVYDMGETDEPYVILKERPKVEGVVIVAKGGASPGVITEITDAMESLFGLEAHKVKVVKMSVQEESL